MMINFLQYLPPELSHRIALRLLQLYGAMPALSAVKQQKNITCLGLRFANRVGVAAGLDKDGEAFSGLMRLGFGFVEIGSVTPEPQSGNPLPRLFRLLEDKAVINRMGFNNRGIEAMVQRVQKVGSKRSQILGINIGPNKVSADPAQDYVICYQRALHYADYFTINISSPNTPGLRALQRGAEMRHLLRHIREARQNIAGVTGLKPPMLIKIAPDWQEESDFYRLLDMGVAQGFDGFVISNTTVSRPKTLRSGHKNESGGLSGEPLFGLSTARLAQAYQHLAGTVPLVGVGGISCRSDAMVKLQAGAELLQTYSAFTTSPRNIVSIFRQKCENPGERVIVCSDSDRSVIGSEVRNLDQEHKVHQYILSQKAQGVA